MPQPLKTTTDPLLELAAAVVLQAVRDLHDADPITALDALGWFVFGDGPAWLEALEMPDDPDIIIRSVTNARKRGQLRRVTAGRNQTAAA